MTDVHTLAGAYALDAVTDLERAAFRRHLAGCESCALEVAEFGETAARLADPTGTGLPPGLRAAVLARVAHTPQTRPGRPRMGRPRMGRSRTVAPVRWRRWTAVAAAAGAGGAGYLVRQQQLQDARERAVAAEARVAQIDAVLTAPDAVVRQQPASGSGTVTVVGSQLRGAAVVVLAALPDPPADQAYQLWLGSGGELTSAGVLPAGQGSTIGLLPDLAGAELVGVSLEPATGSPTGQPTEGRTVATVPLT